MLTLPLAACGGASASGGNTGGGSGSGSGGNVNPTSGKYLVETGYNITLSSATIDSTTGAVSSPTVAGGQGANSAYSILAASPSGNFAYAFNEGSQFQLVSFQAAGPGLQLKVVSSVYPLTFERSLVLHPAGKFLYVIQSRGIVQEILVDPNTGILARGAVVQETADMNLGVIDPTGKFLFVNDDAGGRIFAYQINQTDGSLTAATNSPFELPPNVQPSSMTVGGSGNSLFLYVVDGSFYFGGGVIALSVDSSTGVLAVIPGSPFRAGNNTISFIFVDPSRRYLYGASPSKISGFVIDPTSGVLSPVPGSPFTAFLNGPITVDPSGKFLYVPDSQHSTIDGFSLDPATGRLSVIAGSPFPAVAQPSGLAVMNIP